MSQRLAVHPDRVARVVEKALTAPSPRPRYPVGIGPAVQMALLPKLPTRLRDLLLSKMFGQR